MTIRSLARSGRGGERAYRAGLVSLDQEHSPEGDYVRQKFVSVLARRLGPDGETGTAAARHTIYAMPQRRDRR
jgi:hypothetical protein